MPYKESFVIVGVVALGPSSPLRAGLEELSSRSCASSALPNHLYDDPE
jgi:hypothetical protein